MLPALISGTSRSGPPHSEDSSYPPIRHPRRLPSTSTASCTPNRILMKLGLASSVRRHWTQRQHAKCDYVSTSPASEVSERSSPTSLLLVSLLLLMSTTSAAAAGGGQSAASSAAAAADDVAVAAAGADDAAVACAEDAVAAAAVAALTCQKKIGRAGHKVNDKLSPLQETYQVSNSTNFLYHLLRRLLGLDFNTSDRPVCLCLSSML